MAHGKENHEKLFEWDPSFNVNIKKIDEQHKHLFEIINEYFLAMMDAEANEVLSETIDKLLNYAEYHFSVEEDFFIEYSYIHIDNHIQQHAYYFAKIKAYQTMVNAGVKQIGGKPITVILWIFLKEWLINHIKIEDMKYRDHFISTGDIKHMTKT